MSGDGNDGASRKRDVPAAHTATAVDDELAGLRPWGELGSGTVVGSYVIEHKVAAGGFGTVYRARHAETGAAAAIKIPSWRGRQAERFNDRFAREIEAVSRVRHPNVVAILEFGALDNGRPYLAMPWLSGRTLREELQARGPMSEPEAVFVLRRVALALQAAHGAGIVHRDLKPSNVMLVQRGEQVEVVLLDFGLAKLYDLHSGVSIHMTVTGEVLGTPQSMAPEQIRGRPTDTRTDVYAFGVLAYTLVVGSYPFDAGSFAEIRSMHLAHPAPRPSDRSPVGAAVDALVVRCMEKEPDARFQDVDEVLAAIDAIGARADPRRFSGATRAAIAVYAVLDGATGDALEEAADAMDEVTERCEALGLVLALEANTALLAVALLPGDEESARRHRLSIVEGITALVTGMTLARVRVRAAVHAGPVETSGRAGGLEPSGGELLNVDAWPEGLLSALSDVAASAEAVEGLADALDLVPVGDGASCWSVALRD